MHRRVAEGISRLRGLRDGDQAVLDLISCGEAAIGPLREFLFERDPSGIFLPRCQAVEVLSALAAKDVLTDYLAHPPEEADPVEQAGIDVVIGAVARALIQWPDDQLFALLLQAAGRKLLPGVVDALGQFGRDEAVPVLTAALGEDFCRSGAEAGFRRLGTNACSHLRRLAKSPVPTRDGETEMSRRRRRSALRLWGDLCPAAEPWDTVRPLLEDADDHVAYLACAIGLQHAGPADLERVAQRLVALLRSSDWLLRVEVEDLLVRHFTACRAVVERTLDEAGGTEAMSLRYVLRKASTSDA